MTGRSKFLVFLPALLLILLSLAMAWLLRSESGARFIWQQASSRVEGQMQLQRLTGSLSSGLELHGFSYRNESVQITSPDISLSLDIDMFPPALHLTRLHSSAVEIHLPDTGADEAADSLATTLESLSLPYPVRFDQVTLGRLRIEDELKAELFAAADVAVQAEWHDSINISRASLHALDTDWQITARLQLQTPFASKGSIAAATLLQLDDDITLPVQLQADFDGDLGRLATRVQSSQPDLTVEGELLDLLTHPGWDLELAAAALHWPPAAQSAIGTATATATVVPLLTLSDVNLSSQGSIDAFAVQAVAELTGEQLPGGSVELQGKGDSRGLHIDFLSFAGEELKLAASGQLDWQQGFSLTANTRIENLQPQRWLAEWPEAHPLHGDLRLEVSEQQLGFSNLKLAAAGLATQLLADGSYHFDEQAMAAEVRWQSLAWPIGAEQPDWSSSSGQLQLQGTVDQWQADGELQLLVTDFPESRLQLHASGNQDAVQLLIPDGQVLGGQFAGEVNYQWAEPSHWSAEITAERINTAPLLPDFPGVVSGTVVAQSETDSTDLQFELRDVQGRIRELDFTAQGKLSLQDSRLEADGLQFRSHSARLDLDGGMGPGQVLKFAAEAADLSQVLPGVSGQLQASGELSLDARSPRLEIKLDGEDLRWGENHIAAIRTQQQADGSTLLQIDSATLGGRQLQDVQLILAGSQPLQAIQLRGVVDGTLVESSLGGKLQSTDGVLVTGWQGDIGNLRLSHPERGFMQLDSPAPLLLTTRKMELGYGCLRGPRDGRICLQAHWAEQGEAGLQTEVQQVSLDIVRLFVDMDWAFTHRLDGRLDWHRSAGQPASATAQFNLSPGDLLFEDDSTNFSTGPGVFEFRIDEGNLHSGQLNIPIIGSGGIDMDFAVIHLQDGATAEVQAKLKIQLRDLTPLQLLPYVDVVKGELNADITVAGSLQQPQFTGHATLVRGHIEEQAAGLVLSEIQLAGAVYQYDHTELNGSFRAGEGRGRIKADLRFGDFLHPEFSMQLSGENLLLVDVPDMNIAADPELDFHWVPGQLRMNGKLRVPRAQLSPRYLPASTAGESPDLRIVSGQEETAVVTTADTGPLRITGQVEVELGPEVELTLDKATANIQGKSNFMWNDNLVPVGDGAFVVSGEIYAYGQLLKIREGRVSFPKVPADNPHLNIKAEREIFGNSQTKRAGVRVSGTLKRPSLDPYTDPMSNRERALALLLTGSDFDYEQGVGAVEVGMYVAPKLFISYGIGLFEDQNVISARYDLGKGFGVKATSGQRETGVDISYTVDN
jgi:translocation and assembly module TamB